VADPTILIVTSAGSSAAAVVPVLAAIEAAGMRVRAIDLGGAGGGGGGMADRVRRALLGEGAERRLRKELEASPPDAAVVFDPHAALALTVARDQVQNPAPVIGVVADLEPDKAWASTDADRFIAIDDLAAVALADAGVEGDRILVAGAIGERAFAEAGAQERSALRTRFKLGGKVALVEVAGLGGEATGQLAMQLSLMGGSDQVTFLFDAGSDTDAAAVLRRQVPALGLKAKLFGQTADAPLLWRAADAIVARPRPEVVSRVMLVGGLLVAMLDDAVGARAAAALEARKRALPAKGLLLLSSALEAGFKHTQLPGTEDGADNVADIVAVVALDKRGIIDERRSAAHAATRDRVRAATSAASAVAATTAMPGDLEDLSGGVAATADEVDLPDAAELARLRTEVKQRVVEMTQSMGAARAAASELSEQAKTKTGDEAAQLEKRADIERTRMHRMLSELATLEAEHTELERLSKLVAAQPPKQKVKPPRSGGWTDEDIEAATAAPAPPSIDEELEAMRRRAGAPGPAPSAPRPQQAQQSKPSGGSRASGTVEDELAALKRKMAAAPPLKKK
jgi:hypothetical protein